MGELLVKSTKLKSLLALSASALLFAACEGQDAGDETEQPDTGEEATGNGEEETVQIEEPQLDPADADIEEGFSIGMITDEGGVDDRSFNQSAWEGMNEWAQVNDLGDDRVQYYQSDDASDFIPNLQTALANDHDIIYGIGFLLLEAIEDVASDNPDQYFGIVDDISELDNVVSITFADHEAAFLAGVAAAHTTETDHVGFIGGIEGPVIDRFQTGFEAGVAHVDENIQVDVEYAGSFDDASAGQQIASTMYSAGADIVYHAAGAVGNGVFTEARNRLEDGSETDLWVIGVDRDQHEEGNWAEGNFTLTSTLKEVGMSIGLATNETLESGFPGGENIAYGLEDEGVGISAGNLTEDVLAEVEEAREGINNGEIEVPEFSYSE